MHLYAFESICRGEIDYGSDIDLLAIVERFVPELDPAKFSIYRYSPIEQLWDEGNPFAWHLATESKLLFSSVQTDFISELGRPNRYAQASRDCRKFQRLFRSTRVALERVTNSPVFELSTAFLAIRNFATCYALSKSICEFSRYSPRRLGDKSLPISDGAFCALQKSRALSPRGYGIMIAENEMAMVLREFTAIADWINELLNEVECGG